MPSICSANVCHLAGSADSTTMYASASIFSMVGSTVGGAIGRRIRRDCPVGDGWKLSRTPGSGASPDKTSQSCADGGMARLIGRRSARGDRNNAMRPCFSARSEEHTSELQSLMRISYAVFCLKKKTQHKKTQQV